ncbi:MAG: argininosuccinate lyase [Chloroflexi bacterium]|nr:argininosuccinate lyase [Chloroflexota bacterium]
MNPPSSPLNQKPAKAVEAYTASLAFDRRLYRHDIAGSIAQAKALNRAAILTDKEMEIIIMSLVSIREEIERGEFPFREEWEDIHMNIEARLHDKIGEVAGKLHTGRSRNDQVALDMRLYLKEAVGDTLKALRQLQEALITLAEAHPDAVMPGYTHLQRAQPVLLAHHLLAYFEMLERDRERFQDCLRRADVLPLGSSALAGTPYPVDREFLARELGFPRISANSMDAVADRDFVIEYLAAASIAMMHLSRLAEEIVLWSSEEFGFVAVADAYATGSSIMPQKRNPDVAELGRGKAGRVFGHLMALLTTMKGLPLTYNRDLQEDKEALFDAVDTLLSTLGVFAGMVGTLKVNASRMKEATEKGFLLATDLADYLVRKGFPFRQAHGVVASVVRYAMEQGKELGELSLEEYQRFSPLFEADVLSLTVTASLAMRSRPGGTAPEQVRRALAEARRRLEGA